MRVYHNVVRVQVRSEIQTRELEQEAEMERLVALPVEPVKEKKEIPVVSTRYSNHVCKIACN